MNNSIGANLLLLMNNNNNNHQQQHNYRGERSTPSHSSAEKDIKPVKNFNLKIENLQEIDRIIEEDQSLKPAEIKKSPQNQKVQRKGWGNV